MKGKNTKSIPIVKAALFAVLLCAASQLLYAKSKAKKEADKRTGKTTVKTADKSANKAAETKMFKLDGGNASLVIMQQKGVWRLYTADDKGNKTAVLSEYDEGASNVFFLKAGRAEYKLNSFGGADVDISVTDKTAVMEYGFGAVARASVLMTLMKSDASIKDYDIIKVKVTVTNLKKRSEKFALKGVFDTVLEERPAGGLSTKTISKVAKETQLLDMKKDMWVCSTDGERAVQFLLYGADITPPDAVTIANSEIVNLPLWTPVISAMRSFDNVMMFNNSAVCINWPQASLEAGSSAAYIFYIALTPNGTMPNGEAFIMNSTSGMEYGADAEESAPLSSPKRDVLFDAILDDKVDGEYIRTLIRRINALENDGSNTNIEELLQLNAELDRVLDILKNKR